jgi:arginine decarboxylase
MNTKYSDLINQTYYFPQDEFTLNKDNLKFHNVDLMKLVEEYGTPLKFTYLPQISNNINKAKIGFVNRWKKNKYEAYYYCYCTKSSHFEFIMNEAFKNNIHIETSSAFDINIVENLVANGKINKSTYVM